MKSKVKAIGKNMAFRSKVTPISTNFAVGLLRSPVLSDQVEAELLKDKRVHKMHYNSKYQAAVVVHDEVSNTSAVAKKMASDIDRVVRKTKA